MIFGFLAIRKIDFGEMSFGKWGLEKWPFGKLKFGKLNFGKLGFGKWTFGIRIRKNGIRKIDFGILGGYNLP